MSFLLKRVKSNLNKRIFLIQKLQFRKARMPRRKEEIRARLIVNLILAKPVKPRKLIFEYIIHLK